MTEFITSIEPETLKRILSDRQKEIQQDKCAYYACFRDFFI